VHPGRGQGVPREQAAAGPVAGGDDGPRDGEHRRLVALRDGSPVEDLAAEDHVHQDDEPQPRRARHEHRPGRRGDQAVDDDETAVPDGVERPRQRAQRAGVGSRPRALGGDLGHAPPGVPQVVADGAVVAVAAADPHGVVDPGRDDDVDAAHRRRS
jgi:hypothetical protein